MTAALAVWRAVEVPTVQSLLRLQLAAIKHGNVALDVVMAPGDALIARSRARLATRFLESRSDVLLFVDSDVAFDPEGAFKVCTEALKRKALVGGMYLTRSSPAQPAVPLPAGVPIRFAKDALLVAVDWLVTGFLATPRCVFETLAPTLPLCDTDGPEPFRPFYQPEVGEIDGTTVFLSEDYSFCLKARNAGFEAFLDPSVEVHHYGTADFLLPRPVTLTREAGGALRQSAG